MSKSRQNSSDSKVLSSLPKTDNTHIASDKINWGILAKGLMTGIKNRNANKFPYVKLNADNSVSILMHSCNEVGCGLCQNSNATEDYKSDQLKNNKEFELLLLDSNFSSAFEYYINKLALHKINPQETVIQSVNADKQAVTDIHEYRINLSPSDINEILMKTVTSYAGYRNENSILKLNKTINLKKDFICLWPISKVDNSFLIRASGCQMTEIPGIQLLHLLFGNTQKEEHFHYLPNQVETNLNIHYGELINILNEIMINLRVLTPQNQIQLQSAEGMILISPPQINSYMVIKPLDDLSRSIYSLYGNMSEQQLASENCESLEINIGYLMDKIRDFNLQQLNRDLKSDNYEDFNKALLAKLALQRLPRINADNDSQSFLELIKNKLNHMKTVYLEQVEQEYKKLIESLNALHKIDLIPTRVLNKLIPMLKQNCENHTDIDKINQQIVNPLIESFRAKASKLCVNFMEFKSYNMVNKTIDHLNKFKSVLANLSSTLKNEAGFAASYANDNKVEAQLKSDHKI